ncbi:MAG: hypothetical protein OXM55_07920 [Bdellovibrionales bacterium]|nr:hypothetical protein [Bdellovibrionales bacterium]
MGIKKKKKLLKTQKKGSSVKKSVKKNKLVKSLKKAVKTTKLSKAPKKSQSEKKSSRLNKKEGTSSIVKSTRKKKTALQLSKKSPLKTTKSKRKKNITLEKAKKHITKKKKEVKTAGKTLESAEKRKVLELKKELEILNKKAQEKVLIRDTEGRLYCHDEKCDQPAVTDIYCRYHYLALWKYLQTRKRLLEEKYLFYTINELIKSFGEGALYFIIRDFKNEKTFETAAKEMSFSTGKEEDVVNVEGDVDF